MSIRFLDKFFEDSLLNDDCDIVLGEYYLNVENIILRIKGFYFGKNDETYNEMKILRRFGVIDQSSNIKGNIQALRDKQKQQLSLLVPLKHHIDNTLLKLSLADLAKVKN